MANSLPILFKAIAQASNQLHLQREIVPQIGQYFQAKRYRLFLINQLPLKASGLFKQALSLEYNPVLRYLFEHHAPVHEDILLSALEWKTLCPRFDHGHVMIGPIVAEGMLIGGLGVTRDRYTPAFDQQNIAEMSALCLHISTFLAQTQPSPIKFSSSSIKLLTPREIEIAELIAQGLTNAEIGKILWIQENSVKQALKRIFRKLNISSRTALTTMLFQSQY